MRKSNGVIHPQKKCQIHRCYWKMFLIITLWLWIFHAFRICAGSLQSFKVCASEVPEHKLIKVMCKFSTLNLTFGAQIRLRPDFCIKIHWIFCPPYSLLHLILISHQKSRNCNRSNYIFCVAKSRFKKKFSDFILNLVRIFSEYSLRHTRIKNDFKWFCLFFKISQIQIWLYCHRDTVMKFQTFKEIVPQKSSKDFAHFFELIKNLNRIRSFVWEFPC